MSAELATRAPGYGRELRRIDILRKMEFDRRLAAGIPELEAWAAIITDANLGMNRYKTQPKVHTAEVFRTLARFKVRTAPGLVETARAACELDAAAFSSSALRVVKDVAEGQFEDSEKARTQLAGAKEALKIIGVGADKQTRVTAIAAMKVNLGAFVDGA